MRESTLSKFYISHYVPHRIASIQYSEKDHTAMIAFENRNAAETALMVSVNLVSGKKLENLKTI